MKRVLWVGSLGAFRLHLVFILDEINWYEEERVRGGEGKGSFYEVREWLLPLNSVPDDFTVDHWDDMGEAKTGIDHDGTFRSRKVWLGE